MKKYLGLIIALAVILSACGGRLPSTAKSQKIIYKYFKKYSKKYPDTIYGQHGVIKVEVEKQHEIRKHFASVEAYLKLGDSSLRRIYATVEKKPFGWDFISWEDATGL